MCDRICENVHIYSSQIQSFNFKDSPNLLGMTDRLETCRVYRATIPLSLLQISDLYTVSTRLYDLLSDKNRMCELCMFSQIWSQ